MYTFLNSRVQRALFLTIFAVIGVLFASGAQAANVNPFSHNTAPFPVSWQQNSINWDQLQALFSQNPDVTQFSIAFPNGSRWNINPASMEAFYTNYVHQATAAGVRGTPPNISFSPLVGKPVLNQGTLTLPTDISDAMQEQIRQLTDQLAYEKSRVSAYLPDWLNHVIAMIWKGFSILYDFAVSQVKKWF